MSHLLVPVLAHRKVPHTRAIDAVPLGDALTRRWSTRACSTAYAPIEGHGRLVRERLGTYAALGGVVMQLLVIDLDNHDRAGHPAPPIVEWRATQKSRIDALLADHSGYVYETPRGYRLIWRLAEPMIIADARGEERWRATYTATLATLADRYGYAPADLDPGGSRWGQTFDLPRIVRDGVALDLPTRGDVHEIGTWSLKIADPGPVRERGERTGDAADSVLVRAFASRGREHVGRSLRSGRAVAVRCPWHDDHTRHLPLDGSTVVLAATTTSRLGTFVCSHSHCRSRTQAEVRAILGVADEESPSVARLRADLTERDEHERVVELAGVEGAVGDAMRLAVPGRLVVAIVPPGAGKTRAAIHAIADDDRRAVHALPRHELIDEVRARYAEVGVEVQRRAGITSRRLPSGEPACRQQARALALVAVGGSVWRTLCPTCVHAHGCPARTREDAARVAVVPHQLGEAAVDDAGGALLVVDESPTLVEAMTLARSDLDAASRLRRMLGRRQAEDVHAWTLALRLAALDEEHDLAAAAARVDGEARAAGARWTRRIRQTTGIVSLPLATAILRGRYRLGLDVELAEDTGALGEEEWDDAVEAQRIYRALLAAAHEPHRIAWRRGGLAVHATSAEARLLVGGGAVLPDATPDLDTLRVLCASAGIDVVTITVRVPDGARIERVVMHSTGTARARLAPGRRVQIDLVRPLLARALDRIPRDARTLVVTHKPVADALRGGELADLLAGRVRVPDDVAHFGAVRGIDRWRAHDACVTLGDPWPDIGLAREQARVLGLDTERHLRHIARAELAQAHGRLRAPSRSTPATLVHVGVVAPLGWTAEQTAVELRASGRPRAHGPMSSVELLAWVRDQGSERAAARALGIHRRTLARYLGGRALPAELAARITHRGFGATSEVEGGGAETPVKDPIGVSAPPPSPGAPSPDASRPTKNELRCPRSASSPPRPEVEQGIGRRRILPLTIAAAILIVLTHGRAAFAGSIPSSDVRGPIGELREAFALVVERIAAVTSSGTPARSTTSICWTGPMLDEERKSAIPHRGRIAPWSTFATARTNALVSRPIRDRQTGTKPVAPVPEAHP